MHKLAYPAVFVQDGDYLFVNFPDLPGTFTQGKNLEEAHKMAKEVLGITLANQKEHPKASSPEEIKASNPGKEVALISLDLGSFLKEYHYDSKDQL